jgi:hypothetical protein
VASIEDLRGQLMQIVQGAVRKVLAWDKIGTIMLERSKFGASFNAEVIEQLKQWGWSRSSRWNCQRNGPPRGADAGK